MGSRGRVVLLSIATLLLVHSMPVEGGESQDSVWLLVTSPDEDYVEGEALNFTVHVFNEGEYTDVDAIEVLKLEYDLNASLVEMEPVAKGRWNGSIVPNDWNILDHIVELDVNVTIGDMTYCFYKYIRLYKYEEYGQLSASHTMSPSSVMVDEDDVRTITWEVRYDGELVDPDTMELLGWGGYLPDSDRVSEGIFRTVVDLRELSDNIWGSSSERFDIRLTVYYENEGYNEHAYDHVYLYLNVYHVWAKAVEPFDDERVTFEFIVTDMEGRPVPGAELEVSYGRTEYNEYSWWGAVISQNFTADDNGRAIRTFPIPESLSNATKILFSGRAGYHWTMQDIRFVLDRPRPGGTTYMPAESGCDVRHPSSIPFGLDADVEFNATIYNDGMPWSGETYYTIWTTEEVLAHARVFPDENGNVTISLHGPLGEANKYASTRFAIKVELPGNTSYREEGRGMVFYEGLGKYDLEDILADPGKVMDEDISFGLSNITLGRATPVRLTHPNINGNWSALVIVGFNYDDRVDRSEGDWTYLSNSPIEGAYADYCDHVDGGFEGEFFIPPGLPGQDLYVMAYLVDRKGIERNQNLVDLNQVRVAVLTGLPTDSIQFSEEMDEEDADLSVVGSDDIMGLSATIYWAFAISTTILVLAVVTLVYKRNGWGDDLAPPVRYGSLMFVFGLVLIFMAIPALEYDVVYHDSFEPELWIWPLEPANLDTGTYVIWVEDPGVVVDNTIPIGVGIMEVNEGFAPSRIVRDEIAGLDCVVVYGFDVREPGNFTVQPSADPETVVMDDIDIFIVRKPPTSARLGLVGGSMLMVLGLGLVLVPTLAARYKRRKRLQEGPLPRAPPKIE